MNRLRFLIFRMLMTRRGVEVNFDAPFGVRMESLPTVELKGKGSVSLRFGRGVSFGRDLHLVVWAGDSSLTMGDGAYLQRGVRMELRAGSIAIGPHAHVRDGVVLKSQGELTIGEEVTVSFGDVIACTERIEIGDFCGLGERVTITDSDHTHDGSDTHYLRQPLRIEPVRLGRNVLVSAGAVIARGARIGDNAVVAANAVVTGGDHEGSRVYAGAPATVVRTLRET